MGWGGGVVDGSGVVGGGGQWRSHLVERGATAPTQILNFLKTIVLLIENI